MMHDMLMFLLLRDFKIITFVNITRKKDCIKDSKITNSFFKHKDNTTEKIRKTA
jgi:hypothetical protein